MSEHEQTISVKEDAILSKEEQILKEIKQEEVAVKKSARRLLLVWLGSMLAIAAAVGVLIYVRYSSTHVFIDNSDIEAEEIDLGPSAPGVLQELDVHEGDTVPADTVVARVGDEPIKSTVGGLVLQVKADVGKLVNPGDFVVVMIDPNDLHVVGRLQEDQGLEKVQVGQRAVFTVDAFGSRKFYGTVDEVSPTSRDSGIVLDISDKRETREFDVKVRFDIDQYPELKNGMSAKITVLTN